jgi:DNA end-binding protein Ku
MAPRSSWKGFIKLSLVSVPVKAYTASISSGDVHLNQLHQECNNRIRYKKTCPVHGDVPNEEIVSGYEFAKGQYVVVDLDELSKLRAQSDKSINVDGFVADDTVDPMYFSGRTYYLLPDGPVGQKPYALLREAMGEGGVVGIAHMIIAGRDNLVLLRPMEGMITANVLQHAAKVKAPTAFKDELVETAISKEEQELARTLVKASQIKDFDFAAYKDDYTEQLTTLIQSKVEGREIVQVPEPDEPQIINLMEALRASVARAQGDGAPATEAKKPARKKMAPSASSSKPADGRKKKSG